MSKYIVLERTSDRRLVKRGEWAQFTDDEIVRFPRDSGIPYCILRRLADDEVEALEAKLATVEVLQRTANDLALTITARDTSIDYWKARAKKAEAERDELRANAEHAAKLLAERDELTAEVDELRAIVATFRQMAGDARTKDLEAEVRRLNVSIEVAGIGYRNMTAENERLKAQLDGRRDADTRARFERETAADLMRRIVNVDVRKDGSYGFEYARASKCVADARDLADVVFAPAPAPVKVDAPPAPWTPKVGDMVKIIGSTFFPYRQNTCSDWQCRQGD